MPYTPTQSEKLAREVLEWAAKPQDHGGMPYSMPMVKLAQETYPEEYGGDSNCWDCGEPNDDCGNNLCSNCRVGICFTCQRAPHICWKERVV